jgi:hypothetical protein
LLAREVDASGWIFANTGPAFLAWYPLAPYEWQEEEKNWRLHSPHLKNGAVVQVARASDHASFDAFKEAVRALAIETSVEGKPSAQFTTLSGEVLAFGYDGTATVNGEPIDYASWPLYGGPFVNAAVNSRELILTYKDQRRRLDFAKPAVE